MRGEDDHEIEKGGREEWQQHESACCTMSTPTPLHYLITKTQWPVGFVWSSLDWTLESTLFGSSSSDFFFVLLALVRSLLLQTGPSVGGTLGEPEREAGEVCSDGSSRAPTTHDDAHTFERTRDERLRNQQKAHDANERTRAYTQDFGAGADVVVRQALGRIGHVDAVVNDPDYKFEFPTPDDKPAAPIISFSDASFGYPGGPSLFKNWNFAIDLHSRLAMGPNGIGKSTLLKLISGELEPTSGVFRSAKVRMAGFRQHHLVGLDLSSTPLLYDEMLSRCARAKTDVFYVHLEYLGTWLYKQYTVWKA
ncbi:unnamed protein product [Calypogeia fissa]